MNRNPWKTYFNISAPENYDKILMNFVDKISSRTK